MSSVQMSIHLWHKDEPATTSWWVNDPKGVEKTIQSFEGKTGDGGHISAHFTDKEGVQAVIDILIKMKDTLPYPQPPDTINNFFK